VNRVTDIMRDRVSVRAKVGVKARLNGSDRGRDRFILQTHRLKP
jgi:hypothetical protein